MSGPFLVDPWLDPKPWGGRRLEAFGFPLPAASPIGEALITAEDARVASGPATGRHLGELVADDPPAIVGRRGLAATGGIPVFPLLVKLIDAAENLSIQVHPDDRAARSRDRLGKTEAWHVLDAAPGAVLFLGLRPEASVAEFTAACRRGHGEAAACLRRVPAIPGATLLIPAGTVHALGAGVVVYEVQQPSDLTYRLDDWGRVDADGRPRELHLEDGLAVLDDALRPEAIAPVDVGTGRLLTACRYFALEQLSVAPGEELPLSAPESAQAVTCLSGATEVRAGVDSVSLTAGSTLVVPAGSPPAHLGGASAAVLLRAWVPDLEAEIVGPARAAGAADDAIARLAGPLPDVSVALPA